MITKTEYENGIINAVYYANLKSDQYRKSKDSKFFQEMIDWIRVANLYIDEMQNQNEKH